MIQTHRAGFSITDNNPVTVQILEGVNMASFNINVGDQDGRSIFIMANTPIRTELVPDDPVYASLSSFSSVSPRMGSMIGWHFIPLYNYSLRVYPETTPAVVTISMTKSESTASWIYNGTGETFTEKNILFGGKMEQFGLANKSQGYYNVTITTDIPRLGVGFTNTVVPTESQAVIMNYDLVGSTFTFGNRRLFSGEAEDGNKYGIYVSNPNSPNQSGTYSITIQKVGVF